MASGFVLAASTCGLSALHSSALSAVEESVRADRAGLEYAVQAGSSQALKALAATEGLVAVRDADAFLTSEGRQATVQLRTSSETGIELGTLVEGDRAVAGAVTVSRHAAAALEAKVGDKVELTLSNGEPSSVVIAGITTNAANVDDATVVAVDPELNAQDATVWLSSTDPYLDSNLQPFLDTRTITYQSAAPLVSAAQEALPAELAALKLLPMALAFFLMVLIAGAAAAMGRTAASDARALSAGGMPAKSAWKVIATVATGALVAGMFAGFVSAWAALASARTPLSNSFGQDWTHVAVPVLPFFILCAATLGLSWIMLVSSQRLMRTWARLVARRASRSSTWVPVAALAAGVGSLMVALVSHRQSPPGSLSAAAPYAAALIAMSLPWLVAQTVRQRLPRATASVLHRLIASGAAAFVVAALIVGLTSATSARRAHDANAFESRQDAPQPAGSLLVTEVPDRAGDVLIQRFEELGGRDVARYRLPDESKFRVRSTGPRLIRCMADANTLIPDSVSADCFPQDTMSPVNTVALADSDEASADPGLVEDGRTGLLIYTEMAQAASSLAETEAVADDRLGGNMPGLVLPAGGETAQRLGLTAGGTSLVAMLDFHSLGQVEQAELRGLISRVAPAAQVADSASRSRYDTERSLAAGSGVIGAALALLVVLAGGMAVLVGERQTLLTLVDIGGASKLRLRIIARWAMVGVLTAIVLVPLSRFAAGIAGVNAEGSVGSWWLAPPVAMAVGCAALVVIAMGGVRAVRE